MFAYVLASFRPGTERDAFDKLSSVDVIKGINLIFGEWDIIMKVETDSPQALEKFIIDDIRALEGNKLTSTMIVAR